MRQSNLTAVYNGSCDPCACVVCDRGTECLVDSSRQPNCSCVAACIDVVEPVCASNGKTYRNRCTMDQVTMASRGQTLAKERAFNVVNVLQEFYGFNCLFELSITLTTEDRLSQMVG